MNWLFNLCVDIMEWLAKVFSTTYVNICVVFNLYVQGFVLAIFALWAGVQAVRNISGFGFNMKNCCASLFAVLQLAIVAISCVRYWPPLRKAFFLCVDDLRNLAAFCNTTYEVVNIVIFVILYLLFIGLDIYIIKNM